MRSNLGGPAQSTIERGWPAASKGGADGQQSPTQSPRTVGEETVLDAGEATAIPTASRVVHPSTGRVPSSPIRHNSAMPERPLSGSDSDDPDPTRDAPPHSLFGTMSRAALEQAPETINKVHELISHLMVVGLKNTSHPRPPPETLSHHQRIKEVLHDQCHTMLKGLHQHLSLLFQHFQYTKITDLDD